MQSNTHQTGLVMKGKPTTALILVMPLLLCMFAPVVGADMDQEPAALAPEDIWSDDYINTIFPWAPANDRILQFKEYHTYETMKNRMLRLAEDNPDIFEMSCIKIFFDINGVWVMVVNQITFIIIFLYLLKDKP